MLPLRFQRNPDFSKFGADRLKFGPQGFNFGPDQLRIAHQLFNRKAFACHIAPFYDGLTGLTGYCVLLLHEGRTRLFLCFLPSNPSTHH